MDIEREVQEAIGLLSGKAYGTHNLSCDCVFCKAIDLAITALKEYQPWIPVSERLPMDSVPVLVTYIGLNDGNPCSDGIAQWSIKLNGYNGGWAWSDVGLEVAVEITHWMPLPEPPKGE